MKYGRHSRLAHYRYPLRGSQDPRLLAFKAQKYLAGKRGIDWQLTYGEWLQIWDDSGHADERGKHKGQWVMARKGDVGPYSVANVRIVRAESNIIEAQAKRRPRGPEMAVQRMER